MAWRQISLITGESKAPDIADALGDLGALSVTYLDAEDEPVYEPAVGETKIWSSTQVVALYDLDIDCERIKSSLFSRFRPEDMQGWKVEEIADQPWERAWMEHYRPMKFAGKLWVCPTGQEQHEKDTVCLLLDPGLAFGTGTHPTTALCLEWLAGQDLTGKTVIDYGCGSGILAIAAVLLGAAHAHAVDIDPQALTATQMNAAKNQIEDKISLYSPEQFHKAQRKAGVVVANILAKPLIEMAQCIVNLIEPGGQLILSGILAEQAEAVREAYTPKLKLTGKSQQEDWIRLTGVLG